MLAGAVLLNVSLVMEGCNGKIPPVSAIVPTAVPTLAPNVVSNFENQSIYLNQNFYNDNGGVWVALPAVNFIFPGGANGTNFAGNMSAGPTIISGYSPYQLTAVPNLTGAYNLLGAPVTTGIQFYWKTGVNDTMIGHWFVSPIAPQLPPQNGGDCPGTGGGCYDTFRTALSPTAGAWTLVQVPWSSLNQSGWGFPQVGPLTGSYNSIPNESRIMYFQWEEDPGGSGAMPFTVNFWVDEVQLY